jgi:hypothetical protein
MVSPTPGRVARRTVLLYTLLMRFTVETNANHPRAKEWLEVLSEWVDRLEVRREMEPYDTEILAAPLGELDQEQQASARWSGEAAGVLGWALQRVAAPADFDPVDPNKVFPALGFVPAGMVQGAGEFIAGAALRPQDELLAYYAHLRIVQFWIRGHSLSAEGATFLQYVARRDLEGLGLEIREAEWAEAQEGVARLSEEQRRSLLGNCVCRIHAAAWLVGCRQRYWEEETEDAEESY